MTAADKRILELAAEWRAVQVAIDAECDEKIWNPMATLQCEIQREMATLAPTTAIAAIEQLDLLSTHDDAGMRALGVLRGLVRAAA